MALLDALIFSVFQRDNHLKSNKTFYSKLGHSIHQSAFGERRFAFLEKCLYFDGAATEISKRLIIDKLTHVRKIYSNSVRNCSLNYNPSSALTVDEELLAF